MEFLSAYKLSFEYQLGQEAIIPNALSHLNTVVLEPGWLPWVSRSQNSDPELAPLIVHAKATMGTSDCVGEESTRPCSGC